MPSVDAGKHILIPIHEWVEPIVCSFVSDFDAESKRITEFSAPGFSRQEVVWRDNEIDATVTFEPTTPSPSIIGVVLIDATGQPIALRLFDTLKPSPGLMVTASYRLSGIVQDAPKREWQFVAGAPMPVPSADAFEVIGDGGFSV